MVISVMEAGEKPPSSLLLEGDSWGVRSSPALLTRLTDRECEALYAVSTTRKYNLRKMIFHQGDVYSGILIILSGQVRVFYTGPSGREITLAYWSSGNFIGEPEIFGGGPHMWSGEAARSTEIAYVEGRELLHLMERYPNIATALIEALVLKGKCYSGLVQMLGTRSAAERLAQLLVLLADSEGRSLPEGILISRSLTQEELARMVGSTRQWVATTLERFRGLGLLKTGSRRILLLDKERLRRFVG